MPKIQMRELLELVSVITVILSIYSIFYNTPDIIYEMGDYSLPAGESLFWLAIRNEGATVAEDVEINLKVKGDVTNSDVVIRKGRIDREIEQDELYSEPNRLSIYRTDDSSSLVINMPNIPSKIKYTLHFNYKVSSIDYYKILISCKNCRELGHPYSSSRIYSYFIVYFIGILSIIIVNILRNTYLKRNL